MVEWFRKYNTEITWAIIGWLAFATIDSFIKESYIWVLIDIALIYINYKLWKNR